jgi:hypothetical protein
VAAKKKTSTPEKRALIMWALLVRENSGAFQSELKPKIERHDRDALEENGHISWRKVGQKIWIEVTDKGWTWAGKNLSAPLPAASNAGAKILEAWLAKLQLFMNARGLVLADVLGPQNVSSLNGANNQEPAEPDAAPSSASLSERIRVAYLATTGGGFNKRALLKDIRARLKDVDRRTLDQELKLMQREERAVLYALDNRAEITEADRQAAISFAGEPRHILWMER